MAQPEQPDQRPNRVPIHHVAFGAAILTSAVTIAVQVMQGIEGHHATEQAITSLRVAAVIVWCWYFAAYIVHVILRRFDAIEERLDQLEGEGPDQVKGLDAETIDSARAIARQLLHREHP